MNKSTLNTSHAGGCGEAEFIGAHTKVVGAITNFKSRRIITKKLYFEHLNILLSLLLFSSQFTVPDIRLPGLLVRPLFL
jgi:hypothetical protein